MRSPTLINHYAEGITADALEEATEGITINGKRVNNLLYAESLLDKVNKASRNAGILINKRPK